MSQVCGPVTHPTLADEGPGRMAVRGPGIARGAVRALGGWLGWCVVWAVVGCGDHDDASSSAADARFDALSAELDALRGELADTRAELAVTQAALTATSEHTGDETTGYTDEDAVAAVQNDDPWSDPERGNLRYLWSGTDYGYQWLADGRWTMDNRADPAGAPLRHELVQMFHETPECLSDSEWADCDTTTAQKVYVNGPRITDNDWSPEGFAAAAVRRYHTHASGLFLVSFGQLANVTDHPYGLIPPSGIHLEPHGAHQALRIDGVGNSGDNVRIETTLGSTGIAIYESPDPGLYCESVRSDCTESYPLYLRGGRLHLEDLTVERSLLDARGAGVATLGTTSLGIEPFYSWYTDAATGLPVHCTWNETVTEDSVVRVSAFSTSPDLLTAHSYAIVDIWGPGDAPAPCTASQNIKTNASGVYGYVFDAALTAQGGFSVAILGSMDTVLYPGDWDENDRPSFSFEVVDALVP